MTVCIYHFPPDYPAWTSKGILGRAVRFLSKASRYRRNPRDRDYMEILRAQGVPGDAGNLEASDLSPARLRNVEDIVLLWPDGSGYGWFPVERRIWAWKEKSAKVRVLNGRRRSFRLTSGLWAAYLFRRFMERFWIGELAFSLLFFVVSPFLVIWDIGRGKD